jgi:nucleoside-diphosphate kinase
MEIIKTNKGFEYQGVLFTDEKSALSVKEFEEASIEPTKSIFDSSGARFVIIVKPDAVKRGLGLTLMRKVEQGFLEAGLNLDIGHLILSTLSRNEAEALYEEHKDKSHFNDLIDFMISGNSMVMMATTTNGNEGILLAREIAKQIRAEYGTSIRHNCIHISDSVKAGEREANIFLSLTEVI